MAACQQVTRQAWRVFVNHTRTELYEIMDSLHQLAMAFWRSYDGNNMGSDVGPFELMGTEWYKRNRYWGPWLKRTNIWATQSKALLDQLVAQLQRQCGLSLLMFKDNEDYMDETLYLALAETKDLLACFIVGWKVAVYNMNLEDWICFDNQVVLPPGCEDWHSSRASNDPASWLRLL